MVGRQTRDPLLDPVELSDAIERLLGDRRSDRGVHIEELAPDMCPTASLSDTIAGKQFILYRNPTFIGSGPECQIYLFRDPKVGRRHAAVHIVPGGFDLQNLPLGAETKINGKLVERARLHNGDVIQVGNTSFRFQEKTKEGKE